jgi:hypothetical protein
LRSLEGDLLAEQPVALVRGCGLDRDFDGDADVAILPGQ